MELRDLSFIIGGGMCRKWGGGSMKNVVTWDGGLLIWKIKDNTSVGVYKRKEQKALTGGSLKKKSQHFQSCIPAFGVTLHGGSSTQKGYINMGGVRKIFDSWRGGGLRQKGRGSRKKFQFLKILTHPPSYNKWKVPYYISTNLDLCTPVAKNSKQKSWKPLS